MKNIGNNRLSLLKSCGSCCRSSLSFACGWPFVMASVCCWN